MDTKRVVNTERVDDIPLLLARQQEMGVGELIDKHFTPHGNWSGASLGEIAVVWLTFILSEGDHRLSYVEEWFERRQTTVRHYIGAELTANNFRDDRLAILLRALSDDETWSSLESALNQRSIRVYDLKTKRVRLDTTTASGHWQVTKEGLFQYGHSKDHRPDLPQLKVMLATLDPLGMPLATTVVHGNRADDPLYVPAIEAVRQSLKQSGLLYIGDVKMAAHQTRTIVAAQDDFYLCPLSAVQMPPEQLLDCITPALQDESLLTEVERTQADGETVVIADAFEREVEQTGSIDGDADDEEVCWTERQIMTRSHKHAQHQSRALQRRLQRAQDEIAALHERKQGKTRLEGVAAYQAAVEAIVARRNVAGLLHVEYESTVHERHIRKYGDRPARIERTEEVTVSTTLNQDAIDAQTQTFGWRVYVTNAADTRLSTAQAVVAYREQYREERAFGRLKGKPLSLTPMYLERDDHATGLVRLLSIGLRILSLLQFSVRRSLQHSQTKLAGLYAGNPKRTTHAPTAERILAAFKDVFLTLIEEEGSVSRYLSPLSDTQLRILDLLGFDQSLYLSLVHTHSWNPPIYLHEP